MNKALRHVTLSVVVCCLFAVFAPALAGPPGMDRRMALTGVHQPNEKYSPLPASFGVNIEQAATQDDPTTDDPVEFVVLFDTEIDPATFTEDDLFQNGSAGIVSWGIDADPGNERRFFVTANGLTAGTVIPTIPAGAVCDDDAGAVCDDDDNTNQASVSVDNSVTYGPVSCATFTYLYVAIWSPPRIRVYCVEDDGALTFQNSVDAPGDVRDMQVSADGLSLYYAHAHLTRYTLSTDGSIVEAGSNEVGNGSYDDLVLDPGGRYLYGTHSRSGGTVFVYDTTPTPAVNVPPQVQMVDGFYIPHGLAIDSSGQNLFIANYFNPDEIVSFPLLFNGRLDLAQARVTGFTARAMYFAVNPRTDMDRLYWTETSGGSVITGELDGAEVSPWDADFSGWGARQLTIDADGSYVYVANYNNDDIGIFQVAGSGGLIGQGLAPTARRPEHLILHPGGGYLYVASAGDYGGSSTVSIYDVSSNGNLSAPTLEVIPDQGAYRLAIVDLDAP